MHSLTISMLAQKAAADPFKKIKGLIQKLIERLLEESKNEATKKGFCDMELAKAKKERDFRFTNANDLSADLSRLEAKEDALTAEIHQLTKDIKLEKETLEKTTNDRKKEQKQNQRAIDTAQDGLNLMREATILLKETYKQLAFVQDPRHVNFDMNKDGSNPGFAGTYHGAQGKSKAIFALLEQISDDFDRTIRTTETDEEASHRDFVDYQQAAESSIAGKETQKDLDEQDLKTTKLGIDRNTDDMQTAVDLLDAALKELE